VNDARLLITGFVVGAATVILRELRLEAPILAAARAELDKERRRNALQAQQIARLEQREGVAAANIVQLAHALHDATAQVAAAHDGVGAIGAAGMGRFSLN
jgi:hypothetical protein